MVADVWNLAIDKELIRCDFMELYVLVDFVIQLYDLLVITFDTLLSKFWAEFYD